MRSLRRLGVPTTERQREGRRCLCLCDVFMARILSQGCDRGFGWLSDAPQHRRSPHRESVGFFCSLITTKGRLPLPA